ncbi:MAG: hypothetical protein KCHDKBKB_01492 [Elusimicrobia bacterium]|nr:hypothetical protein [Elusimicrobiota bacterium]
MQNRLLTAAQGAQRMISADVSVVLTCFNYGDYVASALDSVLQQSLLPKEIIVINDGSTDRSSEVLSTYQKNPRVRVVSQTNGGQAKAKNRGVRESSSEWIAFLDADDVWESNKLERQSQFFENPSVGVIYSRQIFIDSAGKALQPQPFRLPVYRGRVTQHLLKDNFVPFSSSLVRRSLFVQAGGFDESLSMSIDWDLWLKISLVAEFDFVDSELLRYRTNHPGQMSKMKEVRRDCCDRIFKSFVESHKTELNSTWIKSAEIYTLNFRAYDLRTTNPLASFFCYLKSAVLSPWQWAPWKGLFLAPVAFLFSKEPKS